MKNHCDDEHCGLTPPCKQEVCEDQDDEASESPTEVVQQPENATDSSPELCPECDISFENVFDLLIHAKEVHEFNGTVKREVFPSYSAFEEAEKKTRWVRKSERVQDMVSYVRLRCLKKREQKAIEAAEKSCTSFINVKRYLSSGVTSVQYCMEHFGHKKVPRRPPVPLTAKMEIVELLKQGLTFDEIVYIFQNDSVALRQVKRIAAVLRNHPEVFEPKESTSKAVRSNFKGYAPARFRKELGPSASPSEGCAPKRIRKEKPRSSARPAVNTEDSKPVAFIKEEPVSAMALLGEASSRRGPCPVEAKPPWLGDEVRAFTLTVVPDGKGFALVDQASRTRGQQQGVP